MALVPEDINTLGVCLACRNNIHSLDSSVSITFSKSQMFSQTVILES